MRRRAFLAGCAAACLPVPRAHAAGGFFFLGSTTTTENSGFLDHIRPLFEAATGVEIRVVVAGSGKILKLAENGDVDATLTHDPDGERAFVEAGFGAFRRPVMVNDFLIVGPMGDPAKVSVAATAKEALDRIASSDDALFVSRGDESGTHRKELALRGGRTPEDRGYRETGSGMGATLSVASAIGAYTLVDRATWASFGARGDLIVLLEGDPLLANPYAAMLPSPDLHPRLRIEEARLFIDWLTGPEGRAAIASFRIDGEQAFKPIAP